MVLAWILMPARVARVSAAVKCRRSGCKMPRAGKNARRQVPRLGALECRPKPVTGVLQRRVSMESGMPRCPRVF